MDLIVCLHCFAGVCSERNTHRKSQIVPDILLAKRRVERERVVTLVLPSQVRLMCAPCPDCALRRRACGCMWETLCMWDDRKPSFLFTIVVSRTELYSPCAEVPHVPRALCQLPSRPPELSSPSSPPIAHPQVKTLMMTRLYPSHHSSAVPAWFVLLVVLMLLLVLLCVPHKIIPPSWGNGVESRSRRDGNEVRRRRVEML